MLTASALDRFNRELSVLQRASWSGFGKVPTFRPAGPLVPDMGESKPLKPLHDEYTAKQVARSVRRARIHAAQQSAMDAPFADMARAKAGLNQGAADGPERAPRARSGLGLVSNATTVNDGATSPKKRPLREKLLINRDAQRVKRLRTSVGHVARLLHFDAHTERDAGLWNKKFITLTYADADAWRPDHFSKFRKALWHWCRKNKVKCRYVWVAELQKRGALHYHVVVWLPKGKFLPEADTAGWWPHGMTNIKTAQSPISYIAKYASKTTAAEAAVYPKGARMHGHGGLDPEGRRHVRYWMAPIWVREALSGRADIRKVVGGYMNKKTGEFLASPWRVCVGPGGEVWAYRIDQQETMQ